MDNIKNEIGQFVCYRSPTTMEYGFYYKAGFKVPFDDKPRTVRVWLPEDYDFYDENKRFPVMYFADGQNLVNRYLTAYGDWGLDKVAHRLLNESGVSFIAVGVDSPSVDGKRNNELCPPFAPDRTAVIDAPAGDKFVAFIADELKPVVDGLFFTKKEKAFTAIAGSSMGGIAAFYGGATRGDIFGFALDFSPAFLLYKPKTWRGILDGLDLDPKKGVRHFLYVGGVGFESKFVSSAEATYKYMLKRGFTEKDVAFIYDSRQIHHEDAWHKYLGEGVTFWLAPKQ